LLCLAKFSNHEEELNNAPRNTKGNVQDFEISLREVESGGQELKRAMKEATNSEYAVSQKLAYGQELVGALRSNSRMF
jgi:hypothetical protein